MLRIFMNNSFKVNIKSQIRYLHDRKLPEVKFRNNYNDSIAQKKYKKNEPKNVKNKYLENDEREEQELIKNFGLSIKTVN